MSCTDRQVCKQPELRRQWEEGGSHERIDQSDVCLHGFPLTFFFFGGKIYTTQNSTFVGAGGRAAWFSGP